MKLLFAMASAEYLRYYDGTLRLLVSRGHEVVVAVNFDREGRKPVKLDALTTGAQGEITIHGVLPAAAPWWGRVSRGVRGAMDFVRYLDPRFADAPALRARMRRKVLPAPLAWLAWIRSLGRGGTRALLSVLRACELAIPTSAALDRLLRDVAPDAVVVSPLVDAASPQVDMVKSARRFRIPVAAAIASWDNLTNKGLLRIAPDQVIVWNEAQKAEAVAYHGVPAEAVAVTGAQLFDRWFERTPSRDRAAFCERVGLPTSASYLLFTCSSGFIAEGQSEVAFVREWVAALRASGDPAVVSVPILVRPHPYNTRAWTDADLTALDGVAVWPRGPFSPVDEESRNDFFDSMAHSAAVVGINTSAMIEAAIVGRPVLSVQTSRFSGTQEGTLHFHHLLPENGGFLRVASSLDQHVGQLAEVLAHPEAVRRQTDGFVDRFIRPHGRQTPATPILAGVLEALPQRARRTRASETFAVLLRPAMWVVAAASAAVAALDAGRARKAARLRWHSAKKTLRGSTSRVRKTARTRWQRARKTAARWSRTVTAGR